MLTFYVALLLSAPVPSEAPTPDVPDAPIGTRECKPLARDEKVRVDFADVPIFEVARLVSCALDKNLLFQPGTLGEKRVTVLGPRPVGRRDLEVLWYALLADNDLVEETHGAYRVVRPVRR